MPAILTSYGFFDAYTHRAIGEAEGTLREWRG